MFYAFRTLNRQTFAERRNTSRGIGLGIPLLAALALLIAPRAAMGQILDGPVLHGAVYQVRAQVHDYTTLGSPGAIATISFSRDGRFIGSRSIVANRNETVVLQTSFSGRRYAVTCSYRGRSLTKYATATNPYSYVRFEYANGRLY